MKINTLYNEVSSQLLQGDCLEIMKSIEPNSVQLIYIDPPFGDNKVDKNFGMKWQSTKEHLEWYRHCFGNFVADKDLKQTAHYLYWLYPRIEKMRDLLADNGSIYVHCDYRVTSYLQLLLRDIFGNDNFRNIIIWQRATMSGAKAVSNQFGRNYDSILFYSKSETPIFNRQYLEYSQDYIDKKFIYKDKDGRIYRLQPKGTRSDEAIERLRKENKIVESKSGYIQIKFYLDEMNGVVLDDVWVDIQDIRTIQGKELYNFPTQKPEALLERIINASSNEGDLVADFFCGSGTTAAVAEKLGRKWICCDTDEKAIQITKNRINKNLQKQPNLLGL